MTRVLVLTACLMLTCAALHAATPEAAYTPRPKDTLTYTKDIAPIMNQQCVSCHRPGEVAPFPLQTYKEVAKRDVQIAMVAETRLMPPWKPVEGHGQFHDERRLSADEIGMLQQWVDEGSKEGDPKDLPPAPKFTDGWHLGEPDLIVEMPECYTVPAEGRDIYRCFVVPLNLKEERFVKAVEFRPGNRSVVHHAILYLDDSGWARKRDEMDPLPGYSSLGGPGVIPSGGLGGWTPGATPYPFPEGVSKSLKPSTDVVMQLHLHPTGKPETERSKLGLYFAKEKPTRTMAALTLVSRRLVIPAGEKAYLAAARATVPVDVEAVGIIPHAHLLAKDIRATAFLPDGSQLPLLWIDDWDFNWQGSYRYRAPVKLPKGTEIEARFVFDNSAENRNNPSHPPKRVTWGEQTTDEMALLWVQVLPVQESDAAALLRSPANKFLGAFAGGETTATGAKPGSGAVSFADNVVKRFDANSDGKLDAGEEAKLVETFDKLVAKAGPRMKDFLKQYDNDGDGKLSDAERESIRKRVAQAASKP
ncbi:MAG: ascorbate-dependent monooxygenase [Planctomycetes bacterium]|nr:ascorbate-dependent monooxygenase [Planctomycetota bacterium]